MLQVEPIKTKIFRPSDDIYKFISNSVGDRLLENRILAVTCKIVSLAEKRLVSADNEKLTLIQQEADTYLAESPYGCHLTAKEGILLPSAGIDESNSETGEFILYPKDPFQSAKDIYHYLKQHYRLNNFGVIITDSHTHPLRKGVIGTAVSYYGFKGVRDKVGDQDLFGKPLKMTTINVVDSLAVAATLMMGEGSEQCPLACLKTSDIEFSEQQDNSEIRISLTEDLYSPLFKSFLCKQV